MAGAPAQARPAVSGLRGLSVLVLGLLPTPAAASPWEAPDGGQTIVQVWVGDEEGRPETEAQFYREARGPFGTQVTKFWAQDDSLGRTFEASVALRRSSPVPLADVAAVEAGVIAIAREGLDPGFGAEARVSAGWTWGPGLYAVADLAGRAEEEGVSPRWGATLGRSDSRSLAFVQVRYEEGPPGRGFERAEAALVWFGDRPWGVQIGVRAGLAHDEQAFTIGLWRRPGGP